MEGKAGHLLGTGFLNVLDLGTQSVLLHFLILSQMQDTWGCNSFMTSCEFLGETCPTNRENCAAKEVYKEVGEKREEEREVNREVCKEGGKEGERGREREGGISQNAEEKGQTGRRCPLGVSP